jgi:NAD(P)H-hydrate epimerase
MSISNSSSNSSIRCISPEQAAAIDVDLMSPEVGFRLEQLMELAGLSCAAAVSRVYPRDKYSRVLVVAGPGNNGGDALVAARHLHHFGYKPHVIYPKTTHNTLYLTLLAQLKYMRVPVSEQFTEQSLHEHDVVLDGIFGFSFKGEVRAPFDTVLKSLNSSALPIVSIDIPSGWDVTQGNVSGQGLTHVDLLGTCSTLNIATHTTLVSLTAPKPCAKLFKGTHYLGGRFIPE